ncbi:10081_t:CDS:2, partial [Ambispora leptoticha]
DEELRLIFEYLDPHTKAPSADLVRRHILCDFDNEYEKLRKKLQDIPGGIAVTTDMWTTDNYDNMKGSHTGAAIAEAMEMCLQKIGIITKVVMITCDNASSNN